MSNHPGKLLSILLLLVTLLLLAAIAVADDAKAINAKSVNELYISAAALLMTSGTMTLLVFTGRRKASRM